MRNSNEIDREMKKMEKAAKRFARQNAKEAKHMKDISSGRSTPKVDLDNSVNRSGSAGNDMLQFFLGFMLLGGGLFWLFNSFTVDSGLGGFGGGYFNVFGMRMTGGVMLIPLMLGIGLIFFLDGKKRFIGYFTAALGLLVIVIALISSLSFHAKYGNTLYVYVIMFAMIAAGAGLLIKSTFKKKN
ncbi:MAG: hypothetical protein J6I46_14505 [Ruminococcus sp.]|nr:hypothetical protein [Ruminococcus sp.]MBP3798967.1 hypothetical protein [Ruminococcus sp.]